MHGVAGRIDRPVSTRTTEIMATKENASRASRYRAPALEKGLDVIELLAEEKTPLNLSAISQRLDHRHALIHLNISEILPSSRTVIPRLSAFASFEPASSPATTKSVFLLTDDETRPPRSSISLAASSRV